MSSATVGLKMSEKPNSARAVPVRVKKKTLKKLSNSERLEIENAKMEERLRQLRSTIEQEKKQRDSQPQTGYLWKSGKEGAVTTHAKEHMNKNKINHARLAEKKIKVKFLTPETEKPKPKRVPRVSTPHNSSTTDGQSWAEPQHNLPRDPEPVAPLEQVNHTTFEQLDNFPFLERQTSIVGPVCGQCELNGAKLNCLECGEKYCGACFASFHKRGALKTHTSRPLTRQVGPRASKQEAPLREAGDLWGEYDESSAAQSFQEALQAWRGDSTPGTPKQQKSSTGITADGSHGTQQKLTEINFSDNQNVSYFERIMLKKSKDAVLVQEDTGRLSRESSQEITVSQLDFCRDLLEQNIIEDREERRELDRPESVMEIVEVNGDIGYLEEESGCEVSEAKCSVTDSEEEEDFEIARRLLNSVKIEEYSPTRIHESRPTTAESNSVRQSASDCTKSLNFRSEISDLVVEEEQSQVKPGRVSSAAGPNKPQRPQTVQPVRNSSGPADVITSAPRFQVENPRSPLLRRMPTNPEISARNSVGSVKSDVSSKRPLTADVTILSSQAWKTSFVGFLKAGLPGHSPAEPIDPTNKEEEEQTGILLQGPPSWCPGESQAHNENFQSRENTISFSVSGAPQPEKGTERKSDISPRPTKSREGPTRSGRRDPPVCQDLDKLDDLEDDSEDVLENLGSELHLQASKSRDLGDYITNLRRATPEALSLLTHEDRMNQLDMESRGISPSATPLLMPRITTRESLFLDFEDVEKQIMAGEDVDGMQ